MTSSTASQSTSPATPEPDLNLLIEEIVALRLAFDTAERLYKERLAQLLDAHAQGLVRSKFTAFDTDFNLTAGRASWSYDSDVTDQIKEIQQWAQSNQKATKKTGTPFWTLRAARNDWA
jgi:hypothetical protein